MYKKRSFICSILLTIFMVSLFPKNLFAVASDTDAISKVTNTWKKVYTAGEICVGLLDDNSLWEWCTYTDNTSTVLKQEKFASPVKMLENVSDVKIGQGYILALTYDNNLWSWGTNELGELGDGTNIDRILPKNILKDVIKISTGKDGYTSFAIKSDGSLWGWGNNTYGQLGDGTDVSKNYPIHIPIELNRDGVSKSPSVKSVVSGSRHTLALLEDGTLWSWGDNSFGQLGNGSDVKSYNPVKIMNDIDKIAVDDNSCFAIDNKSVLFSWGANNNSQLGGDQTDTIRKEPKPVLDNVSDVVPAPFSTYIITTDNTLKTFGHETSNLTDSIAINNSSPVKFPDKIHKISAYYYVLAIDESGSLWMWGDSKYSTPISETEDIAKPKPLYQNVSEIATDYETCSFITNDGVLFQLGNIGGEFISTPRNVPVPTYIGSIDVTDGYMNVQFSGNIPETISSSDFTISISIAEAEQTVTTEVYSSVYSFDPNLGIAVLQLEKRPYNEGETIVYTTSYKGNLGVQTAISPTPIVSYTPEPSSYPTPDYSFEPTPGPTFYSTPELTPYSTTEPSSQATPEPTPYSTTEPSSQATPETTPYSTTDPSSETTPEPTPYSTTEPSSQATPEPTPYSTTEPSSQATPEPTPYSTTEPSSQATPEPTPYSTTEPSSQATPEPTPYSTTEPSSETTPEPTPYSTTEPSSETTPEPTRRTNSKKTKPSTVIIPTETIPGPIPQETPVASNIAYERVVQDFEDNVIEIIEKYINTDDIYNEKSYLIDIEIERAIEKAANIKVVCETGSLEVTQELISHRVELAIQASNEINDFLKNQDYEPNRLIRKMINIEVDSPEKHLNINLFSDIAILKENEIDVKISTSFGNVVLYHENLDKLLSNNLTIIMSDESETENTKIKSKIMLDFKYENAIKKELDYYIGLELPYIDGNPDHCTIYNEPTDYPYATEAQKSSRAIFALNSNNNKMQNKKSEFGAPYGNATQEYITTYGTSNTKAFNLGGHENTENKTLAINTRNSGKYYLIEEKITFNDIKSEDTLIKEAIEVLASKGIINGRGDGSFHPNDQLSRSEFACLIVRSINIIDEEAFAHFEDVKDTSWYYNSVAIAYNEGLISGYEDNTFKANKKINRQEIITICANTLNIKKGYKFPSGDSWLNFTDKNHIPSWARKFISLGNREALIVKRSDGKFNGTGFCTRKDAAIILYRLYKKL